MAACGGGGLHGQVYRGDDLAFRVGPIPGSWRRIDAQGALLVFRDDDAHASIAVNGRCRRDGDDVPLQALTHHLFLDFTEREVEQQDRFDLDGREALRTRLHAKLDGVEKQLDVVVLKKDECVYDFFHVAPPGGSSEPQDHFMTFVRGFATVEP
jgi:hypothetical protein